MQIASGRDITVSLCSFPSTEMKWRGHFDKNSLRAALK